MVVPQKWNTELPYDLAIPLLGIHPKKKPQNTHSKRYMHPKVNNAPQALFTIAKIWKQPKCPSMDEWIKKIYNGILLSLRKEWNLAICNNMNGLGESYDKWNKLDKDKYCMISLICGI